MTEQEFTSYLTERLAASKPENIDFLYKIGAANKLPPDQTLAEVACYFAAAIYDKARRARAKYKYHEWGWATPDWEQDLQRGIAEHVQKGDPRDVAVYAMFAWFHGWSTALARKSITDPVMGPIADMALSKLCDLLLVEQDAYGNHMGIWAESEIYQQVKEKASLALPSLLFKLHTAEKELASTTRDNNRLVEETHNWSAAVKKLEAERAANPTALDRLREAAAPFVKHYAPWMDGFPDESAASVFPNHTLGQLRALRNALAENPEPQAAVLYQAQNRIGDADWTDTTKSSYTSEEVAKERLATLRKHWPAYEHRLVKIVFGKPEVILP